MSRKRKLNLKRDDVEERFGNWLGQLLAIMMPRILALIAGCGTSKTVDVLVERIQEAAFDCAGAPFAFVSDTYTNLHKNVIPSLLEGLRIKGWEESACDRTVGTKYEAMGGTVDQMPPANIILLDRQFIRECRYPFPGMVRR